nr:hypothetical protein [Saccharothrix sp.]
MPTTVGSGLWCFAAGQHHVGVQVVDAEVVHDLVRLVAVVDHEGDPAGSAVRSDDDVAHFQVDRVRPTPAGHP